MPGMVTGAVRRTEERVTPLELFFDLVFVLAITQCTALMHDEHSWAGLGKGLLVLGVLWWCWVGYAWLTSVVDPEEGAVRIAMFAAMGAILVATLCIPQVFGDLGLTFAVAYGAVRVAHIWLFVLASRDDPELRRSVVGLGGSTGVGVAVLVVASQLDGTAQGLVWVLALVLDVGAPLLFWSDGWRLVPGHFAERHGLVMIIAFGESLVALGLGAGTDVDGGVIAAALVGVAIVCLLWWAYFDVVMYWAARNLADTPVGKEQNELARDAYSLLHFPMIAGVVLTAVGLEATIAHVDEPLDDITSVAFLGGLALYLLGHVAFAWRDHRAVKTARIVGAAALLALVPVAREVDAIVAGVLAVVVLAVMIGYETVRHADARAEIRGSLHASGTDQTIPSDTR
jgi:low temperature requirement protein LtrA